MCLLEAHAQVRSYTTGKCPPWALLSGKQEEPTGVLSALQPLFHPEQNSLSECITSK